MGSCFDKKQQNPEERLTFLGEQPSTQSGIRQGVLYRDIAKVVIMEEDSLIRGSSYSVLSHLDSSSLENSGQMHQKISNQLQQSLLNDFQKVHIPGSYIRSLDHIQIRNLITSRNLHSHAIKTESNKLYDICQCVEGEHEHDWWWLILDHGGYIESGEEMLIHHKLTRSNMITSKQFISLKSHQQTALGSISAENDADVWVIEIIGSCPTKLKTNTLFRLKHKVTEGYLRSGKHHGVSNKVFEVEVSLKNDLRDLWYVAKMQSE